MTVSELIEALQEMPQDLVVVRCDGEGKIEVDAAETGRWEGMEVAVII